MIHYIGFCAGDKEFDTFRGNVAGNLKMHYVASALCRAGFDVRMVSLSKTKKRYQKRTTEKQNNIPIYHIASFGSENRFITIFNRLIFYIQIFFYILFKVKKEDTVLVYHSMRITGFLAALKRIKKAPFLLEIEEIYAYQADGIQAYRDKEIRAIKKYEGYILVNGLLSEILNIDPSRSIVLYGSYVPSPKYAKEEDGITHVLYAGAIEQLNKGAFTAIETARYLPSGFKMHIIGNGTEEDLLKLKNRIDEINRENETSGCKIIYDGFLKGEALDQYMSRCHIGLGTYPIREGYSDYIFPSKLISYMAHNLTVVTGRSACYEKAPISEDWVFYDQNDIKKIAEAVIKASSQERINSRDKLIKLDDEFVQHLMNYRKFGTW